MPEETDLGPPISFYGGDVILRFDEKKHVYYRAYPDGTFEVQDGVTNACKIIDSSFYLIPWAVKMMYLKMLRIMPRSSTHCDSIPWADFTALLEDAKKAHREHFEDAGDVGSLAHKWLEDSIRNAITFNDGIVEAMNEMAPVDERAVNCGLAAHKWMTAHNVRWICTEKKVYSRQFKYAGTMDGLAIVDNCDNLACCPRLYLDELALIDWKSSNNLRTEYLYQTAAYQQAEIEENRTDIKARWILRLGKEDGKFESWYETAYIQDFEAFLACLTLQRAHKAVEKRMSNAKKLRTFTKREEKKASKPAPFKKRKVKADMCPDCKHSLKDNMHGFDQNDAHMEGNKLVHHGTCTYCRECNPKIFEEKADGN